MINMCVRACMCTHAHTLQILIMKHKILPSSNQNERIYYFLWKYVAHLKPCGGVPVPLCALAAEQWFTRSIQSFSALFSNIWKLCW